MNSDANIAVRLPTGPKVNGQQNLTGFVEFFFQQYLVDHGRNASYQCCRK